MKKETIARKNVVNEKEITFEVEKNNIKMTVEVPLNQRHIISVSAYNSDPSNIIKILNKERKKLKEILVLAYTEEKDLEKEIYEGIQEILNNSKISESKQIFLEIIIEKIKYKGTAEITFQSIRRKNSQENVIILKEKNDLIMYYPNEEPNWTYIDGKVIIKGHTSSSFYKIDIVEKENYDLNNALKRALRMVEKIINTNW